MLRRPAGRRNPVLRLPAVQVHRVGFVGEQIDGRRAVKLEILRTNLGIRRQDTAEVEPQADLIRLHRWQPCFQALNIHKPESFRKTQELLQNPIARIGVLGIRQQRLVVSEPDGLQLAGRNGKHRIAHHQLHTLQVVVQPQVQRLGNMALAAQVKTQVVQPQGRQRLVGVQRQVHGHGRHFP